MMLAVGAYHHALGMAESLACIDGYAPTILGWQEDKPLEGEQETRHFRTPESITSERITRAMVPDFLNQRGFDVVSDNPDRHGQTIIATTPEGDPLTIRVRLCWRRQSGSRDSGRAKTYSAAQLLAKIRGGSWIGTLREKIKRERSRGVTHFLFVQNDDENIVYAALVPLTEVLPIWIDQRDISAKLIKEGRLGRRKKNHAMNGSSPTLWLQDDNAPEVAQALWDHSGVQDLAKVKPSSKASSISGRSKLYTARICWNSNKWRFPSGEAAHLETGTYVADAGFGHEEWLFNFAWLIDGFHYGFLQPVLKSFQYMRGKAICLLLYTLNPEGTRLYVGKISECEVLQPNQAEKAVAAYRKRGWFKSMAEQVGQVGGKVDHILNETKATNLFNIRFRPEQAEVYDPLVLADPRDAVWQRQRYVLATANETIHRQWQARKGTTTPPLIRTISRKGTPGTTYDPVHKRLQADLLKLLELQYGKGNVTLETGNVDITVARGKRTILIEIKTDPNPRAAIREAIGQLLEYAYYRELQEFGPMELVVIAPGKLDKLARAYIQRLRTNFGIPILYAAHSEGDPLPPPLAKKRYQIA